MSKLPPTHGCVELRKIKVRPTHYEVFVYLLVLLYATHIIALTCIVTGLQ